MAFTDLLGDKLHSHDGPVSTQDALEGKVVGLYFSAHWCPPCRGFTPQLAQIFKDLTGKGKNFQIVFVSSDKDETSFNSYFSEMPWLALPFDDRDRKGKLSSQFQVRGIPSLVLLDEEGNVLTTDGRAAVAGNPEGFPWKPKTIAELLGPELTGKEGPVSLDSLKGKKLALYFSAHWCPPCRMFTPQLVDMYKQMKLSGRDDFEFIFVSSDRDISSFNEYYGEMPWLAMNFDKREDKEELSRRFDVSGIPTLITLDENFSIINKSARNAAMSDKKGDDFPWYPAPIEELSRTVDSNGFDVNEKPAIIALTMGLPAAEQGPIHEAIRQVATAYASEHRGNAEFIFFTASQMAGPVPQVLQMVKLKADFAPALLILDIPDNGGFYTVKPGAIDAASIEQVMSDYKDKRLQRSQMSQA